MLRGPGGRGVSGACVTATGREGSVTSRIGTTGRYFLAGLRPGRYTVRVASCAAPFAPVRLADARSYVVSEGTSVSVQPGRRVTLTAASLHVLRLVMATPAQQRAMQVAATKATADETISGVVRSPGGKPLGGICVTVWSITPSNGAGFGVTTGRGGRYTIAVQAQGLPSRNLRVDFDADPLLCGNKGNYAAQWWKNAATEAKATVLRFKAGVHLKNISATMKAGGEISGFVRSTSKTGHPLRGICITPVLTNFNLSFFQISSPRFTTANGSYTVDDLGTGTYQVLAQPGGECGGNNFGNGDYLDTSYPHAVRVTAGKRASGINIVMHLGGILTGTVSSGGLPAPGVCVDITQNGFPSDQASTGINGTFRIQQLMAGRYQVAFTGGCGNAGSLAPQYYPGQVNAVDAATLTLTGGQVRSGVNAAMAPGATISGLVTTTKGNPLSQVCVQPNSPGQLGPATNLLAVIANLSVGGQTGSNGRYVIRNLAPGAKYLVFTSCNGLNLATQLYAAPGRSQPTLVAAVAGAVTGGVDLVEPTGGTIAGVARDAHGHRLANICVGAIPSPLTSVSGLTGSLVADASNGKYAITGLAAGSYKVEFGSCLGGPYASTWYGGVSFFAAAKTVHVAAGRVTGGINGTLRPGQPIRGTVTSGSTGKPVKSICVTATDSQGIPYSFAQAGPDGRYIVPELAPGSYTLVFGSCGVGAIVVAFGVSGSPSGSVWPARSAPPELAPASRTGVKVSASRPTAGINEVLRAGGHIAGIVLGGTGPVPQPGICVQATPVTGHGVAAVATTKPAGTYVLGPLAAGTYRLEFTTACATGTAALAPLLDPTVIKVKPPQTTSAVDATLASDGQITGTVTNQSSAAVAGICVTAQPRAGGGSPVEAVTGTSGTYTIPLLAPGGYTVEFSSGCGATGYLTQWWDDAGSAAGATTVTVPAGGAAAGVNATLST